MGPINWQRWRQFWWLPIVGLILIGGGLWGRHQRTAHQRVENQQLLKGASSKKQPSAKPKSQNNQSEQPAKGGFIDLKGAVNHPGIYPIKIGQTRLFDVLKAAGDVTEAAETSQLNLAQKLTDQLIIYVPRKGEAIEAAELIKNPETSGGQEVTTEQPTTATNESTISAKINLNQADSTQLQTLSGIGPKKAEQIIAYRDEQGKFEKIEELQKVGGIGPKTFEQLQSQICVE